MGKQAEGTGTSSYTSGLGLQSTSEEMRVRLNNSEAEKGWRKHGAVLPVLALRRTEKAQSGLLGAWDQPGHIMLPAAYSSSPVPALVAQDRHWEQQLADRL